MEYKGRLNGAVVYDDYAHHPTAILGTLRGAREMGFERVICAYQPHTYSRTAGLFEEFSKAFGDADRVYFADIYAARETNESGVSSEMLAKAVGDSAEYSGDLHALAKALIHNVREGDLLIVMGAGDIERVFDLLPLE
jgi:UDP-N-acetylmuramate--alanine ligase